MVLRFCMWTVLPLGDALVVDEVVMPLGLARGAFRYGSL
jgi:hypothetical protein